MDREALPRSTLKEGFVLDARGAINREPLPLGPSGALLGCNDVGTICTMPPHLPCSTILCLIYQDLEDAEVVGSVMFPYNLSLLLLEKKKDGSGR